MVSVAGKADLQVFVQLGAKINSKFWSIPRLSEARTHWTKRLISCEKDWQWLSRQRVVMLNFVC